MPRHTAPWLLVIFIVLGGGVWYTQTRATPTPDSPTPTVAPTLAASTPAEAPATALSASAPASPASPPTPGPATRVYRIDPEQSEASYRVKEVFFDSRGLFTAVGVTKSITGDILLDRANPKASRVEEVVVDLKPLRTDDPDRDRAINQGYLETARYPVARFSNGLIQALPDNLAERQPFTFHLEGDLTVRAFTHRVVWEAEATVEGDELRATATTKVTLTQFGIQVPNLRILRAEDEATLVINLVARAVETPTPAPPTPMAQTCTQTRGNPNAIPPSPDAPIRSSVGVGHVLAGVVRSAVGCTPIPQARLTFWLANQDGQYVDEHRAAILTDQTGAYRFESIFPGTYGGAAPHIHIYIQAESHQPMEVTLQVDKNNTSRRVDLVVAPLATRTPPP